MFDSLPQLLQLEEAVHPLPGEQKVPDRSQRGKQVQDHRLRSLQGEVAQLIFENLSI